MQAIIYKWYYQKSADYAFDNKNAVDDAYRLEEIGKQGNDNKLLYDANILYCRIYAHRNEYAIASGYAVQANYFANILDDSRLKAESLVELGACQEMVNNKISAFRNYKDALLIADRLGDDTLLLDTYGRLSNFFQTHKKTCGGNGVRPKTIPDNAQKQAGGFGSTHAPVL